MSDSPTLLPLQLLQPLQVSESREPSRRGDQPPPPDGDERQWRSNWLRIERNGEFRSIWAVHLAGWQQLGWSACPPPQAEAPQAPPPQADDAAASTSSHPDTLAADPADHHADGEADSTPALQQKLQAMTKAQITAFCRDRYGVSLDADHPRSELLTAALALVADQSDQTDQPHAPL